MTLRFNKRLSITPIEEGGGGDEEVLTVTNKSSQNVQTGDKVWINGSNIVDFGSKIVRDDDTHGSVVITNGIASGFDTSNTDSYINIGTLFSSGYTTWSMETEVTTGNNITDFQNIFVENYTYYASSIYLENGVFKVSLYTTHDSSGLFVAIVGTTSILANTTYKIKVEFTGTAYNLYVNDVLDASLTSSTKLPQWIWNIGGSNSPSSIYFSPFRGTININKTAIFIDDVYMFPEVLVNIDDDSLTGTAKESIAIGESGDVVVGGYVNNEDKSITVNGTYTADTGYTGLGTVTVNVPSSGTYTTMTIPFNNAVYKATGSYTKFIYWWTDNICWTFGNFVNTINIYNPDDTMRGSYPFMTVRGVDTVTEELQSEDIMYFKITDSYDVELFPFTLIIACLLDSEHLGSQCYKSIFGDYTLYWWIEKVNNVPAITLKDVTYQGTSVAGAKLVHEIRVKQ